jgi:hypothetical protein
MLLLGTNTTNTHHAAGTSGLGERLGDRASEGRRRREQALWRGGEGVWKLKEKRGTGGTSDDKRRRAD